MATSLTRRTKSEERLFDAGVWKTDEAVSVSDRPMAGICCSPPLPSSLSPKVCIISTYRLLWSLHSPIYSEPFVFGRRNTTYDASRARRIILVVAGRKRPLRLLKLQWVESRSFLGFSPLLRGNFVPESALSLFSEGNYGFVIPISVAFCLVRRLNGSWKCDRDIWIQFSLVYVWVADLMELGTIRKRSL